MEANKTIESDRFRERYDKFLNELLKVIPNINKTTIKSLEKANEGNPYSLGEHSNYHQKNLEGILRSSVGFNKLIELGDVEQLVSETGEKMWKAVKARKDSLYILSLAGEALGKYKAFKNEFEPEYKLGLIREGKSYYILDKKEKPQKVKEQYAKKLIQKYNSFTPEYRFIISHLDSAGIRKATEASLYWNIDGKLINSMRPSTVDSFADFIKGEKDYPISYAARLIVNGRNDVNEGYNWSKNPYLKSKKDFDKTAENRLEKTLKTMQQASIDGDIEGMARLLGQSLGLIELLVKNYKKWGVLRNYYQRTYAIPSQGIK